MRYRNPKQRDGRVVREEMVDERPDGDSAFAATVGHRGGDDGTTRRVDETNSLMMQHKVRVERVQLVSGHARDGSVLEPPPPQNRIDLKGLVTMRSDVISLRLFTVPQHSLN